MRAIQSNESGKCALQTNGLGKFPPLMTDLRHVTPIHGRYLGLVAATNYRLAGVNGDIARRLELQEYVEGRVNDINRDGAFLVPHLRQVSDERFLEMVIKLKKMIASKKGSCLIEKYVDYLLDITDDKHVIAAVFDRYERYANAEGNGRGKGREWYMLNFIVKIYRLYALNLDHDQKVWRKE